MSTGVINSDVSVSDALQRAKELAASFATEPTANSGSNSPSLKRPSDAEDYQHPAKRANLSEMDGGLGQMQIASLSQPTMGFQNGSGESISEVIGVPDSHVGLVIGRGGEQISQIQQQSGCRVQMSPDSDGSGQRQCTLQGSKMSVERAKQLIHDVINRSGQNRMGGPRGGFNPEDPANVTIDMPIPGAKCGLVIGKQGETIKNLQERAGVKMMMIQDSQEVTGSSKPLRITGHPDKIENAKMMVQELLNSREDGQGGGGGGGGGGHRFESGGNHAKGEVVVPRSSVGMIIGKGGETIKRLAMETGTKIQFKPDDDPSTPDRCAVIMGTREQIYKATELITELVSRSSQNGATDLFYMHVPANKTGLVIGKGGETIKQICAESGAHVELSRDPPPNATEKVFIIKGNQYQIHCAQHIIRIKVGDIAPGTPVPQFSGTGAPAFGGPGGFNGGAQYGGPNQWNSSFGGPMDNGNAWQAQAAGYQYNGGAQPGYGMQPAAQFPQQQYAAAGAQPAAAAPAAAPAGAAQINPATGQPDYSAQWAEYYRSLGMHDQAAMIENQLKQQRGGAAAAPAQPGYPQQQPQY